MKREKLTLSSVSTYEIIVPGDLDAANLAWGGDVEVKILIDSAGKPATKMTVELDQAGLHGILDRLYALGLPIIAVINRQHAWFLRGA